MLGGYRQARLGLFLIGVARFKHVRLLDDLACVAEQLGAIVGQRHAAVAAREDGDAELLLKLLDGRGQVRLRRVKVLSGGVDRPVFGNSDKVTKLLKRHGCVLRER